MQRNAAKKWFLLLACFGFYLLFAGYALADHIYSPDHGAHKPTSYGLIGPSGGTLIDPSGAMMNVSPGGVSTDTLFSFREVTYIPSATNTTQNGYRIFKAIHAEPSTTFTVPVDMQVPYSPSETGGTGPESQFRVFVYDQLNSGWEETTGAVDMDGNVIVASVEHFSLIGLGGPILAAPGTGINSIFILVMAGIAVLVATRLFAYSKASHHLISVIALALFVIGYFVSLSIAEAPSYTSKGRPIPHQEATETVVGGNIDIRSTFWQPVPASKVTTSALNSNDMIVDVDDYTKDVYLNRMIHGLWDWEQFEIVNVWLTKITVKVKTWRVRANQIVWDGEWAWVKIPDRGFDTVANRSRFGTPGQTDFPIRLGGTTITVIKVIDGATSVYNCHGKIYGDKKRKIDNSDVGGIMADDYVCLKNAAGSPVTTTLTVGDIVLYKEKKDDPKPTHSGRVDAPGVIQSKWGQLGDYWHLPGVVPPGYGSIAMICRKKTDEATQSVDRGNWGPCDVADP